MSREKGERRPPKGGRGFLFLNRRKSNLEENSVKHWFRKGGGEGPKEKRRSTRHQPLVWECLLGKKKKNKTRGEDSVSFLTVEAEPTFFQQGKGDISFLLERGGEVPSLLENEGAILIVREKEGCDFHSI